MRSMKLLFLVPLLASLQTVFAEEVTVTLQNGLNGYEGTEDAFIGDWMATKTSGSNDTLSLEFEECAG